MNAEQDTEQLAELEIRLYGKKYDGVGPRHTIPTRTEPRNARNPRRIQSYYQEQMMNPEKKMARNKKQRAQHNRFLYEQGRLRVSELRKIARNNYAEEINSLDFKEQKKVRMLQKQIASRTLSKDKKRVRDIERALLHEHAREHDSDVSSSAEDDSDQKDSKPTEAELLQSATLDGIIKCEIPKSESLEEITIYKRLYAELRAFPDHKVLTNMAMKHSVKWNLRDGNLILEGSSKHINDLKISMGDVQSDELFPTYKLLKDVDNILHQVEHPSTSNIYELFKRREYQKLHIILFAVCGCRDGHKFLELLRINRNKLSTTLLISGHYRKIVLKNLKFFKKTGNDRFYFNLINSSKKNLRTLNNEGAITVNTVNSTNRNLVQVDLQNPKDVKTEQETLVETHHNSDVVMPPAHIVHLLDTADGIDFLNELITIAPVQVVREESKLLFNCAEEEKNRVMEKVNFYFQIREYEFPLLPGQIFHDLLSRLTKVILDYYLIDCKQLYEQIFNSSGDKAELFSKLHGLLFVKYEFLDGKCLQMTKDNLLKLSTMNDNDPISVTDYRNIKTAAMYLFCPFPLDIDYKLLVALTSSPIVPSMDYPMDNYDQVVHELKDKLTRARHGGVDINNARTLILMNGLRLFETHLTQTQFSKKSVEICYAFLNDNFPSLFQ